MLRFALICTGLFQSCSPIEVLTMTVQPNPNHVCGSEISDNTSPVRVLHLLQRMEPAGVQSFLMNLYRGIDRSKVQFDFLVHYKEHQFYDDEIESMGGRIYKLSVREDYNLALYRLQLRRFFANHNEYSILHGHMETLSGIWMKEAERAEIPTRIAHSHTAGFGKGLKAAVREVFRRQYPLYATDLFACSKAAGDFMFPGRTYQLVPNAIDVQRYAFRTEVRSEVRAELGIDADAFVVGHIGRFHRSKNQLFLLEIMSELGSLIRNCQLIIAGDGEERSAIEAKISELGINNCVRLLGKRQDAYRLYQAFDAFVLPSYFEGMPLVGVEAQASGCPSFFSTGVSSETGITKLATFLPLASGPRVWAQRIASFQEERPRPHYATEVSDAGFDVRSLARTMERFYLSRSANVLSKD